METLFLIPLIYVGLWLVLVALQAVFSYGRTAFPSAQESLNAFSERLHDRSDQAAYELGRRARKREFLKWLRAKIGAEGGGSSVNHEVLEAHRQAPILRRLVEVASTAVVAEPGPRFEHGTEAGLRAGRGAGEPIEKGDVGGDHAPRLGLLEHHLAHQHRPRITRLPPRERAQSGSTQAQDGAADPARVRPLGCPVQSQTSSP